MGARSQGDGRIVELHSKSSTIARTARTHVGSAGNIGAPRTKVFGETPLAAAGKWRRASARKNEIVFETIYFYVRPISEIPEMRF